LTVYKGFAAEIIAESVSICVRDYISNRLFFWIL